jgi:hypothetical protein
MEQDFSERARTASGPDRQVYLGAEDIDRVMAVVLALASEVSSLRDRLDTQERVAGTHESVETHVPDAAADAARDAWRDAYIHRIFRVITDDAEMLSARKS